MICSITSLVDIFNYANDNTIGVRVVSDYDVLLQLKTSFEIFAPIGSHVSENEKYLYPKKYIYFFLNSKTS